LINPIITDWDHDTFDYSAGSEVMQHTMSISYETVKYGRGKVGAEVKGFGDSAVYDTSPSPLRAGSTATLFGRGGILDSGTSILDDLASGNILGAIRTGGSLRNTLKGKNVGSIVASELISGAISFGTNYITSDTRGGGSPFSIPSFGGIGSITSGIGSTAKGLFSGSGFSSSRSVSSNSFSGMGGNSNTFDGVSSSANQLAERFTSGTTLNTSDYDGMFATMQSSMGSGMAVAEGEFLEVLSDSNPSTFPNITNLNDSIPSADSLRQIATDVTPTLDKAAKTFAPIAQSLTEQMNSLVKSGEMRQLTNNLRDTAGDVFSNGKNISR
jgi:hypothetical protein